MAMKYKKGDEILTEELIFIILNSIFFISLIFFVINSGSSDSVIEETYAKKIAIILDSMNSNMEVNISVDVLLEAMEDNELLNFIPVSAQGNFVKVSVRKDSSYTFSYFSSVSPKFFLDRENKMLTIKT